MTATNSQELKLTYLTCRLVGHFFPAVWTKATKTNILQCKNHTLPFGLHMTTTQIWPISTNGVLNLITFSFICACRCQRWPPQKPTVQIIHTSVHVLELRNCRNHQKSSRWECQTYHESIPNNTNLRFFTSLPNWHYYVRHSPPAFSIQTASCPCTTIQMKINTLQLTTIITITGQKKKYG